MVLGQGTVVFERSANVGNYSAYNLFDSLPSAHAFSLKGMCAAAGDQTNDLPSPGMPKTG